MDFKTINQSRFITLVIALAILCVLVIGTPVLRDTQFTSVDLSLYDTSHLVEVETIPLTIKSSSRYAPSLHAFKVPLTYAELGSIKDNFVRILYSNTKVYTIHVLDSSGNGVFTKQLQVEDQLKGENPVQLGALAYHLKSPHMGRPSADTLSLEIIRIHSQQEEPSLHVLLDGVSSVPIFLTYDSALMIEDEISTNTEFEAEEYLGLTPSTHMPEIAGSATLYNCNRQTVNSQAACPTPKYCCATGRNSSDLEFGCVELKGGDHTLSINYPEICRPWDGPGRCNEHEIGNDLVCTSGEVCCQTDSSRYDCVQPMAELERYSANENTACVPERERNCCDRSWDLNLDGCLDTSEFQNFGLNPNEYACACGRADSGNDIAETETWCSNPELPNPECNFGSVNTQRGCLGSKYCCVRGESFRGNLIFGCVYQNQGDPNSIHNQAGVCKQWINPDRCSGSFVGEQSRCDDGEVCCQYGASHFECTEKYSGSEWWPANRGTDCLPPVRDTCCGIGWDEDGNGCVSDSEFEHHRIENSRSYLCSCDVFVPEDNPRGSPGYLAAWCNPPVDPSPAPSPSPSPNACTENTINSRDVCGPGEACCIVGRPYNAEARCVREGNGSSDANFYNQELYGDFNAFNSIPACLRGCDETNLGDSCPDLYDSRSGQRRASVCCRVDPGEHGSEYACVYPNSISYLPEHNPAVCRAASSPSPSVAPSQPPGSQRPVSSPREESSTPSPNASVTSSPESSEDPDSSPRYPGASPSPSPESPCKADTVNSIGGGVCPEMGEDGKYQACCQISEADIFDCVDQGTAGAFGENTSPACIAEEKYFCSQEYVNQKNDENSDRKVCRSDTQYCCNVGVLEDRYSCVARGMGSEQALSDDNQAPYCLDSICIFQDLAPLECSKEHPELCGFCEKDKKDEGKPDCPDCNEDQEFDSLSGTCKCKNDRLQLCLSQASSFNPSTCGCDSLQEGSPNRFKFSLSAYMSDSGALGESRSAAASELPRGFVERDPGLAHTFDEEGNIIPQYSPSCEDDRASGGFGDCNLGCPNPANPSEVDRKFCKCFGPKCCEAPKIWNSAMGICGCSEKMPSASNTPICPQETSMFGALSLDPSSCWCRGSVDEKKVDLEKPLCVGGVLSKDCTCLSFPEFEKYQGFKEFNDISCQYECSGNEEREVFQCLSTGGEWNSENCTCCSLSPEECPGGKEPGSCSCRNSPPIFREVSLEPFEVGVRGSFKVEAYDLDPQDSVVLTLKNPFGNMSFNSGTGMFYWTPSAEGTRTFTFEASDGKDSVMEQVTVSVSRNLPPVVQPIPVQNINIGDIVELKIDANDPEGGPLTYRVVTGSGASVGSTSGNFRFVSSSSNSSFVTINVEVLDSANNTTRIPINFQINRKPVFDSISEVSVVPGAVVDMNIAASDPDGDSIRYYSPSLASVLPLASYNEDSGHFRWETSIQDANQHISVEFIASDGKSESRVTVSFRVSENQPPTIHDVTPTSFEDLQVGVPVEINFSASDSEGDDLTFSVEDKPATAQFSRIFGENKAQLKWTPVDSESGDFSFNLTVSDGVNPMVKHLIRGFIQERNANQAPAFEPLNLQSAYNLNTEYRIEIKAVDPEGQRVSYELDEFARTDVNVEYDDTDELLIFRSSIPGTFTFTLHATDERGASSVQEIPINFEIANNPPLIVAQEEIIGRAGGTAQIPYTVIEMDEGDVLNFVDGKSVNVRQYIGAARISLPYNPGGIIQYPIVAIDSRGARSVHTVKVSIR